ncbi:P-loop containing nucleoside triphosphate hydrolase protein [Dunaliella salina]|uniref:P-loop containing nucleoside triphosphate hydrolase protein n=1 Tax=Dunaliella salina TaxID=3046 RepID=A0ABQ7H8Q5_DUNSA|nr:P-loop containing nucleoside triphosphate hydrolase protein [Dunaliella salina]|eukprot:KAF5843229.1 P-loop containing nucleoside triphosphate hydrolase protein [Dunaliella salina]
MSSAKEDEEQLVPAARTTTASSHRGGDGGGQPGGSAHVDIYVRIRPVPKASSRVVVEHSENKLEFNIPRDANQGYVNNQRENYNFRFNGIIGPEAKQDEVFERVARNLVVGALDGFNGIIPRTLSSIFSEVTKRTDHQYQVHVSYLEIYNQTGFDLLDPNREIKAMEDLPQVFVMEDEEQRTSFRNLSIHRANNEEEALNLLFLGDTNRTISETPMNQASSRSHCIFTIYVEARKAGEDVMRRSKLDLADLAGSGRWQHCLKIPCCLIPFLACRQGRTSPHIPYRNSMMTMVLKDSLGGNCRTVMVANINPDQSQLDESISTCRFAMRVALVMLNEEVDPNLIIRRLKQEIRDLREEMRLVKGEAEDRGPLTPDEIKRLSEQVEAYCADNSPEATLNLGGSMLYIRAAFEAFRKLVRAGGVVGPAGVSQKLLSGGGESGTAAGPDMAEQLRKLRLQVQQRDNEINILVGMLKRRDAAGGGGGAAAGPAGGMMMGGGLPALASAPNRPPLGAPPAAGVPMAGAGSNGVGQGWSAPPSESSGGSPSSNAAAAADPMSQLFNANLLADRNKAFELFRKSYRQNEVIEDNKALLKQKYDAAKAIGASVNGSKTRISELKALIEQRRIQRAVAAGDLSGGGGDAEGAEDDPEEARCRAHIEREKGKYKDAFDQLREHKKEIEHLHMLLEQSRLRLQRDFEQWMGLMQRQQQQQQQQGVVAEPSGSIGGGSIPHYGQAGQTSTPRGPRQAWAPSPNTPASPTTSTIPTARPPVPSAAYAGAGSSGTSSSNFGVGANGAPGFQPRASGGSMGGSARASSNGSSMSSPSASGDFSVGAGSRPAAASAAGAAALARAGA